jgi:hypothetical protein
MSSLFSVTERSSAKFVLALWKVLLWYSPNSFSFRKSEDQFIVPDWGDKVEYGIGLSYRPARLSRLAVSYDTLCHGRLYPPVQDYESGYSIYVISSTF